MASDVPTSPLEEIAELTGGYAFKSSDYSDDGRFILRTLNIKDDGSIVKDDAVFLPLDKCSEYERFALQEHDTLFVMVGATLGKVGYVRKETLPALLNQNMWRIRGREGRCDKRYLQYAFRHVVSRNLGWASGSARDFVRRDDYRKLPIPTPPLPEQKAIARILGTLDDKIELNRRMNATLEAMARALFQSWFIDFDPVRRNAARAQNQPSTRPKGHPSPSGRRAGDAGDEDIPPLTLGEGWGEGLVNLDKLFPDSFQDSELGQIPANWIVKTIGETLELAYGKPLKEENRRGGSVAVFGSNGCVGWHDEKLVSGPGIVVGRKGNPGIVTWAHGDFYPIDTTFYVVPVAEFRSLFFLYYALSIQNLANLGADSAVPGLNRNHAYMSKLVIPSSEALEAFDEQIAPIFSKIHANETQSRTLATLRDTLLPKLLSGELSIEDLKHARKEGA